MKIILTTTANQQLPIINQIHIKEWLKVISEREFVNWLRLIVLAFEKQKYVNIGALANELELQTPTFEKEVLHALYAVGLIDVEYTMLESQYIFQHIIIHPFPYNSIEKNHTLKKSRQYRKQNLVTKQELNLQEVLVKHHNKLWNDEIDKAIIVNIFKDELKNPNAIREKEYAALIDQTLTKSTKPILNPMNYFKAVLRNYKEQKLKGMR